MTFSAVNRITDARFSANTPARKIGPKPRTPSQPLHKSRRKRKSPPGDNGAAPDADHRGVSPYSDDLTPCSSLDLILDTWFAELRAQVRQGTRKPATLRNCLQAARHIGRLGEVPIRELTCPMIRRWHRDVFARSSSSTAYLAYKLLRNVCSWCRREGLLQTNPASSLGIVHHAEPTLPLALEYVERWRACLAAIEARRLRWLSRRTLLCRAEKFAYMSAPRALGLLESCGRRIGEVLALRVQDVSLRGSYILLPDTKSGPSALLLSSRSLALTQRQLAENEGASPYLFPSPMNLEAPISKTTVWELHHEVCGMLGITNLTPHGLRYAWLHAALMAGANFRAAGRTMGHRRPTTTELYARGVLITPEMVEAAELAESAKRGTEVS